MLALRFPCNTSVTLPSVSSCQVSRQGTQKEGAGRALSCGITNENISQYQRLQIISLVQVASLCQGVTRRFLMCWKQLCDERKIMPLSSWNSELDTPGEGCIQSLAHHDKDLPLTAHQLWLLAKTPSLASSLPSAPFPQVLPSPPFHFFLPLLRKRGFPFVWTHSVTKVASFCWLLIYHSRFKYFSLSSICKAADCYWLLWQNFRQVAASNLLIFSWKKSFIFYVFLNWKIFFI